MKIGTQLIAPDGYRSLQSNNRYYLIANDRNRNLVNLAFYSNKIGGYSTKTITVPAEEFEDGLAAGLIVKADNQLALPPWLYRQVDGELIGCEDWLAYGREKHRDLVQSRFRSIEPLIEIEREIRYAKCAERYFTKVIKESRYVLKRTRIKNWFYAYLLHGKCMDALLPEFFANGLVSAEACQQRGIKTGRKSSRLGKKAGFAASKEMADRIVEAFVKHSAIGRPMTRIYADALVHYFGCKAFCNPATGFHEYYHPDGSPYPTFWQFKYRAIKEFGEESVAMRIYGPNRAKRRIKADIGPFTESVGNLMERVEFDGYYVKERPRSMLGDGYLTKLCVIRAVDVLSGMIVGIGFSLDSEVAAAYKMCLFSLAVEKVEFCKLFGLEIEEDSWPCQGMPAEQIFDRGPPVKLLEELVDDATSIAELTPSYRGGSKAIVESSHPRDMSDQEAPAYVVSGLNFVNMVRREVLRVIEDNQKSDASSRMTPNMISDGVLNFPLGIWKYMEGRGRSDAVDMRLEEAIKRFLTKTEISIDRRGAFFNGIRYASQELTATGIFDRAAKSQKFTVSAYVFTACVRHLWVEVKGRLIFTTAQLPINDDEEQLYLSLNDLECLNERKKSMRASFKEHQLAVTSAVRSEFERQVGVAWEAGTRKKGRAKKTAEARQEVSDLKKVVNGK